jgi:hypothetical protein
MGHHVYHSQGSLAFSWTTHRDIDKGRHGREGHEWSIDEANEQYAPACSSNATSLSFPVLVLPPRLSDPAYWAHHLTACYWGYQRSVKRVWENERKTACRVVG